MSDNEETRSNRPKQAEEHREMSSTVPSTTSNDSNDHGATENSGRVESSANSSSKEEVKDSKVATASSTVVGSTVEASTSSATGSKVNDETTTPKRVSICLPEEKRIFDKNTFSITAPSLTVPTTSTSLSAVSKSAGKPTIEALSLSTYADALMSGTNEYTSKIYIFWTQINMSTTHQG